MIINILVFVYHTCVTKIINNIVVLLTKHKINHLKIHFFVHVLILKPIIKHSNQKPQVLYNKCLQNLKGQSRMDIPETIATLGTQDEDTKKTQYRKLKR